MKKIFYSLLLILSVISLSSCLEGNLDELPLYEEAEIASVSTVRYRYTVSYTHLTLPTIA